MRILFIAPRLPLPADTGGKIRTWQVLKQLARCHDVDLCCFSFEGSDSDYLPAIKEAVRNVYLVPAGTESPGQKFLDVAFKSLPASIEKYNQARFAQKLLQVQQVEDYDLIHFDHLHMAHYQPYFPGKPCFLDEHNVEYRILERCAKIEKAPLKRLAYLNQAGKMKKFERDVIRLFDGCFAVSQDDRDILDELGEGKARVHVIPNGVDTSYFCIDDGRGRGEGGKGSFQPPSSNLALPDKSIVFTGSMDWLPNDDAMRFCCHEVMPLIWQQVPECRLTIVGKAPSKTLRDFAAKDKRVVVTGRVEDVRSYIDQARVFIVPIRIGGGTRLKILEAMAMGKAVVSTNVGAEGIAYKDGRDIVIADEPQDMAGQVTALLKSPQRVTQIGWAARELVVSAYDWKIVGDRLNKIYEGVLNDGAV